ncbi:hypothetical protein L1987_64195 [Smallanthus sonchifolius]|uniref:Uncharacterized protein n=1 Tax=Smallanthus sonchifolius TaxID=185202 RepID=A0ACB9CFD5_9ASTR|nr:hypothetical protein L1987_64195 [Smallanthus sonchifolius]
MNESRLGFLVDGVSMSDEGDEAVMDDGVDEWVTSGFAEKATTVVGAVAAEGHSGWVRSCSGDRRQEGRRGMPTGVVTVCRK